MKKIFVSLTMLALIFAAVLSGTAFAQTETATVVNWEDVYPSVEESGISGTFYNVGDSGLCMWIPDGIFYEEGTRAYVEVLGKINAALAARADTVIEMVAGIPILLKGELPL